MSISRSETPLEVKEEQKPEKHHSTTQVLTALSKPIKHTWWNCLTGRGLNTHIPQDTGALQFLKASLEWNGIAKIVQRHLSAAEKKGKGISQTWIAHVPILIVSDPALIQQILKFNIEKLLDSETGGVQEKFFGKKTLVSLKTTDREYRRIRSLLQAHIFHPQALHELTEELQQETLSFYIKELHAFRGGEIDLVNIASRIALTAISTRLGFKEFSEHDKIEVAHIVHEIVSRIPSALNASLIALENAVHTATGKKFPFAWHLDRWGEKGDAIITKLINDNTKDVLENLKRLTGNKNLTPKDLFKPDVMGLIKLVLVGGFETTSKWILFLLEALANPKNSRHVENVRSEINDLIKRFGKQPENWRSEELESLDYTTAFQYEVERLNPSFSIVRHTVVEGFKLAQNISFIEKHADEKIADIYKRQFFDEKRDSKDDISVTPGTIILISNYHAHRNKTIYGADAEEFNPTRFLHKKFRGEPFDLRNVNMRSDFLSFGIDKRVCPGRGAADKIAKVSLVRLAHEFDIVMKSTLPLPLEVGVTLELARGASAKATFEPVKKQQVEMKSDEGCFVPSKRR